MQTFLDMVRVNTPPRHEKAASEVAYRILTDLGFECFYDDAGEKVGGDVGNLIAFKKGTVQNAPTIFFSAHFDTVEATPGLEPTFTSIQRDIFESTDSAGRTACTTCHTSTGRNPSGGMNLNHDVAYDQIVGAAVRPRSFGGWA